MEIAKPAEAGRHWSVDAFLAFWRKPDVSRVMGSLTEDIVGYWPRPRPARGHRPVRDLDRIGEDRAGKIQELQPMRRGRYREHMRAGLGQDVARHRDRRGIGLSGDAEPAGDAADLHQVGHDEVAG